MSQMLSIWGVVHPLKWVGNPWKCAVHPRKSLLSGFGMGPVWFLECWIVWAVDGCVAWHGFHAVVLGCGGLGLGKYLLSKCICYVFEKNIKVSSACIWRPGFFSWSCNPLTSSMRSLAILVVSYLGVSIGTRLCYVYILYWPETRIPPVVGTWYFRHL